MEGEKDFEEEPVYALVSRLRRRGRRKKGKQIRKKKRSWSRR